MKTEIGALISKNHFDKVQNYVEEGIKDGGELLCGGKSCPDLDGYFFEPTVIRIRNTENILFRDEVFGPVVSLIPFKEQEEAIFLANKTDYGLAGGIWTNNINRALKVAKNIDAGYLWVNTYGGIIPETPYGGFKQSGTGKELGEEGLEEYLRTKNISIFTGDSIPKWYGDN